ncbi:uncharacterized protein G2W53_003889 [Senna tora]|uniref:RNase H type-1 domain-containing protein n=1 Tax=Senna tora TaxID=362788 RepID=A0A835CHG2_9FABA|nr:uncharacterized protein G2W53_003889 [Senna tora]
MMALLIPGAELWGVQLELELAGEMGTKKVVVEMDSSYAHQLILGQVQECHPHVALITNIHVLLAKCWEFDYPPPDVLQLLAEDSLGVASVRAHLSAQTPLLVEATPLKLYIYNTDIMSSLAQKKSFFPSMSANPALPISHTDSKQHEGGLRRRLSSLSLKIQANSVSPASSWSFPRSKSLSSMGNYAGSSIMKWWDWGSGWILSAKPMFARDLEMNEEETKFLGSHNRGSWRHVFYKVRSEIRRLLGSDHMDLPQTYRYTRNFDGIGTTTTQG